ncbi:MAG: FAD-dependent oxidoreductase, partial [Natronomonas sp.]
EQVVEFLDGDYTFDEEAFRAATIDNFPRAKAAEAAEADAEEAAAESTEEPETADASADSDDDAGQTAVPSSTD